MSKAPQLVSPDTTVQEVAEKLNVRYVLEGSFQKAGERVRINAQLIDAATGHHLWAEQPFGPGPSTRGIFLQNVQSKYQRNVLLIRK